MSDDLRESLPAEVAQYIPDEVPDDQQSPAERDGYKLGVALMEYYTRDRGLSPKKAKQMLDNIIPQAFAAAQAQSNEIDFPIEVN